MTLYKLTTKELKLLLKNCESNQRNFKLTIYRYGYITFHIKYNPEEFSDRAVQEYKTWLNNIKLIREVIEERKIINEPCYSSGAY